jgi:hypothetical protein
MQWMKLRLDIPSWQLLLRVVQVVLLLLDLLLLLWWHHWEFYLFHVKHQQVHENHFVKMLTEFLTPADSPWSVTAFVVYLIYVALCLPRRYQFKMLYHSLHFEFPIWLHNQTLLILLRLIPVELTWHFAVRYLKKSWSLKSLKSLKSLSFQTETFSLLFLRSTTLVRVVRLIWLFHMFCSNLCLVCCTEDIQIMFPVFAFFLQVDSWIISSSTQSSMGDLDCSLNINVAVTRIFYCICSRFLRPNHHAQNAQPLSQ